MDGRATVQDRAAVRRTHLPRLFFWLAAAQLWVAWASAATFSISPTAISNDYRGLITLQIGGLTNGETIRVEKFIDFNTNGAANAIDTLLQSFLVTDGRSSIIGGVTNRNRPGDVNATTGAITARLSFEQTDVQHFSGYQYLFRVSSPTGRFASTNATLRVTNTLNPQIVTGLVKSGTTNVPYAMAALLSVENDGRLLAGTFASTGGLFRLRPSPGSYQLVGVQKGFVTDLENPLTFTLASGATYSNNVRIVPGTRTISGKVVDASNTNLGLPGMTMFLQSSSNQIALAFTDANGVFSAAVTPGTWELEPASESAPLLGFVTPDPLPVVNTVTGNVTGLVLPLQPATAMFYGTLKNASNSALRGIEMYADSNDQPWRSRSQTDSQGNFCVGVTPGNWYLSASGDDLSSLGYLPPNGTNATLANDEAVEVNLIASAFSAHLLGRVIDETGAAVPLLRLVTSDFSGRYSSASSGVDGRFNLGVDTGTWYLRLYDEDARERHLIWPEIPFEVTAGVNISNIQYVVHSATNCITGTIREPEGGVLANVEVWAYTSIGDTNYRAASVRSDASGNYLIYVPDGIWNVGVNCFDWQYIYGCPNSLVVTVAVTKATADITLLPPPSPPMLVRPSREPDGQFRFEVYGASGFQYVVEESADLNSWNSIFSTYLFGQSFEFYTDGSQSARFYRVRRKNF